MLKATAAGVLFTLCSLTALGQSKDDSSKSARDFLIEQEESRKDHPDNTRNRKQIKKIEAAPEGSQSSATDAKKKKKRKCCFLFCRKK
ncbi:hypothetical protein [Niabella aurantiaca]|uniref:hypothetical protein n=1 Tax=Niabella aurantiaca TaxID=379900 RepID=UPI00036A314F|nr:hypothetical protein [Niabella aurantiaca]